MQKEMAISVFLFLLYIGNLANVAWPPTCVAQSNRKSSPQEEFGSSLKRLKWNSKKQAAEEPGIQEAGGVVEPEAVLKVETNLVVLDLSVSDQSKVRAITGLDKTDFVVTEDGVPQHLSLFSRGDNPSLPRSIVVIVDFK